MLRNSWKKDFCLPFSQKSKMADMFFFWTCIIMRPSRFRRYNILFGLTCLWAKLQPSTDMYTHTHTHRISYYCSGLASGPGLKKIMFYLIIHINPELVSIFILMALNHYTKFIIFLDQVILMFHIAKWCHPILLELVNY